MKVKNTYRMRKIQEMNKVEMRHDAVEMKDMKEVAAVLEKMNTQLKEELIDRELETQAKDIVSIGSLGDSGCRSEIATY